MQLTPDEARALLAHLATPPSADDPLPPAPTMAIDSHDAFLAWQAAFAALPWATRVDLVRFARHAPHRLARDALIQLHAWREPFHAIAAALKTTTRAVQLQARSPVPRLPAATLPGHEPVAEFQVSSHLLIGDACYVDRPPGALLIGPVRLRAERGDWLAWVRVDEADADLNCALLCCHHAWLEAAREDGQVVGSFGVDAGATCVVDADLKKRDPALFARLVDEGATWEDGPIGSLGVKVATRYGDGSFPVRAMMRGDVAVALRVNLSNLPEHDFFSTRSARAYSPRERYATGDRLAHATFGEGVVVAVEGGKIVVAFEKGDERRRLVHGR